MKNKGVWAFWGLIAVIALGVLGFFGVRYLIRSRKLAPFNEQMAAYTAQVSPTPRPGPLRGKIIPVDVDKKEVDGLYWDMPEDLRADRPDDVGTVVWLKWDKVKVGTYEGGTAAEAQTADVTVIDRKDWAVTHTTHIQGDDPPRTKKRSETGVGPRPTKQVIDYLKGLPRG
jgi:hypothetical protein